MSDGKKKLSAREQIAALIDAAVTATVKEMQRLDWMQKDFYRTTEKLLFAYPKLKRICEDPEQYGFFPSGKAHDIIVMPSSGSGVVDKVDITQAYIDARLKSYVRTVTRFTELDAVVRLYDNQPRFRLIRMYYFNEDVNGNDRGDDAKRYTWLDIEIELTEIGINATESTLRHWRNDFVREMTVLLFGIPGALSLETSVSKDRKTKSDQNESEEESTTDED